MSWDFQYAIGGTDMADLCDSFRIVGETAPGKRGRGFALPGIEGERSYPDKLSQPGSFVVNALIRYTNASGAVTHVDGAAGHAYENLAELKRLFLGTNGFVTLTRTVPDYGDQQLEFEVLDSIRPIGPLHHFSVLCQAPSGFWESAGSLSSYSSGTGNIDVGGNAPVHDAIVTVTGASGKIELDATGDYVEISGASGTTVIDCGDRTVTNGGSDADDLLSVGGNRWFRMFGGQLNAVTVTGTVQVQWRNKWR